MDPIKEALTFDDVTLAPNYSEILPSETDTKTILLIINKISDFSFVTSNNNR